MTDSDQAPIALTEAAFARLCEVHRKTEDKLFQLANVLTEEHPVEEQVDILRRIQDVKVRARTLAEAISIITGESVFDIRERVRRQP